MVIRAQAGAAADGGVRTRGRGWARLGSPRPVVLLIGLGALLALAAGLAAYQARSSGPAARTAAGDASGMAQQQFLDRNTHLPVGAGVAAGQSGSQQRQLATIDRRDSGPIAVSGDSSGRPGSLGWVEARDYPASPAGRPTGASQQPHLYGIEQRDNGMGATAGDSGPCREPGRSCDR